MSSSLSSVSDHDQDSPLVLDLPDDGLGGVELALDEGAEGGGEGESASKPQVARWLY